MKILQRLQCILFAVFVLIMIYFFNHNFTYKSHGSNRDIEHSVSNGPSNTGYPVSLTEYVRFYKINLKIHFVCNKVTSPKSEHITWHKGVYQKLDLKLGHQPKNEVFGMKFYFDDRFLSSVKERHVRGFVSIKGPGLWISPKESPEVWKWIKEMNSYKWTMLLWYEGFINPMSAYCRMQGAGGLTRNVSGQFLYQEVITCPVPEIGILPKNVSIVQQQCSKPSTNFEIIYPQPYNGHKKEIGVCMSSWYGNFTRKDVIYFVNWMEALKLFGVNEVTVNNSSLRFDTEMAEKVFKYYINAKRLTLTHYPPIHKNWNSPVEDDSVAEGINKITTSDCIYHNLKRYWYVLIIDLDELPVPKRFDTYQDYLSSYMSLHPELVHYHSLSVRSAFFYQNQVVGNKAHGEHLPMLRLTNRFRTEPIDNGIGLAKSFHNMRNMVSAGHHFTRQTHEGGGSKHILQHFLPEKDILIHHYRETCKYEDFCKTHWNDVIRDDVIPKKFGVKLKENVETVLGEVGLVF